MMLTEWDNRKMEGQATVVTVANHKTGDKEPATLVLGGDLAEQMAR